MNGLLHFNLISTQPAVLNLKERSRWLWCVKLGYLGDHVPLDCQYNIDLVRGALRFGDVSLCVHRPTHLDIVSADGLEKWARREGAPLV